MQNPNKHVTPRKSMYAGLESTCKFLCSNDFLDISPVVLAPVVVGSRAVKHWHSTYRNPKDWDIWITKPQLAQWVQDLHSLQGLVELEDTFETTINITVEQCDNGTAKPLKVRYTVNRTSYEFNIVYLHTSDHEVMQHCNNTHSGPMQDIVFQCAPCLPAVFAPIEVVYMLKRSHVYWSIHWVKTVEDIHVLKTILDSTKKTTADDLTQENVMEKMLKTRRKEMEIKIPHPKVFLNMSNETFFAKSSTKVSRIFPHDYLHERVAFYPPRPLYDRFKIDKSKALMNRHLFEQGSLQLQRECAQEEIMVIALERFIFPKKELSSQRAYTRAMRLQVTRLCQGWFRDFLIDHYPWIKFAPRDLIELSQLLLFEKDQLCKGTSNKEIQPSSSPVSSDCSFNSEMENLYFGLENRLSFTLPYHFPFTLTVMIAHYAAEEENVPSDSEGSKSPHEKSPEEESSSEYKPESDSDSSSSDSNL